MSSVQTSHLASLGSQGTEYPTSSPRPMPELLESFPNPFADEHLNPAKVEGVLHIECPEFTSLCPKTGQPDFATIVIDYTPGELCVESKSLKLYLGSFRNAGEFHETVVNRIANDLIFLLNPKHIQVTGQFTPRGGIPFWPTATWSRDIHGG